MSFGTRPIFRLPLIFGRIMNYYFFEDGFFKLLHHIGIAFLLADIESEKIYQWSTLSIGAQVHLGKFQFGLVKNRTDDTWKFISTIDFQIIPLLLGKKRKKGQVWTLVK